MVNNATLAAIFTVKDEMSVAIQRISENVGALERQFEEVQSVMDKASTMNPLKGASDGANSLPPKLGRIQRAQNAVTGAINKTTDAVNGLKASFGELVVAYGAFKSIVGIANTIDAYTGLRARLGLIIDDMHTVDSLNNEIYASAQCVRGSYNEMADNVSKLGLLAGHAFKNNTEMVIFVEQLTKQFKVAGTSAQEASSAMYQLTQAMASGRLQGDEFRSIMENAPMLAQAIANEMNVPIAKMRELSSAGLITSDVIKRALTSQASTEGLNKQFEEIPMRFSEAVAMLGNVAQKAFQPVMTKIGAMLEGSGFQKIYVFTSNALVVIANVASVAVDTIVLMGDMLAWAFQVGETVVSIFPVLLPLMATYLSYKHSDLIISTAKLALERATNVAMAVKAGLTNLLSIRLVALSIRTRAVAMATAVWNAIMSMNPIGIVIGLVTALIAVIGYLILRTTDVRAVMANAWGVIADSAGVAINFMIDKLNALFAVINSGGETLGKIFGFDYHEIKAIARVDTSGIKTAGQDFIKNFSMDNMFKAPGLGGEIAIGGLGGGALDGILDNTKDIAGHTGSISNAVADAFDSVDELRALAEAEGVNNLTRQDIKLEIVNHNTVSSDIDIDGIGDSIGQALFNTLRTAREGI